jgi:hypothetical protein
MLKRPVPVGVLVLACFGLAGAAPACSPATQYNRGIDMSYHPSSTAAAQERVVDSAVELKTDADQQKIKDAGGIYLGELEVLAEKTGDFASGSGGKSLSGRVSLEAANRGATHFYLAASKVEHTVQQASGMHIGIGNSNAESVQRIHCRFVLFRVEPAAWDALPTEYKPELAASLRGKAPAAPAAASAAAPAGGAPADASKPPEVKAAPADAK